jgi:glycosyltransferase involved in cell wall biosynthesis
LKIAFAVHDYHRSGGHSRYVAELAKRYAAAHEVHVFANTFRGEIDPRVQVHRVPAWRANALTLIFTFRWSASRMLRRGRYDIVHDQGLCCTRPNVITAHICNAAWAAARCNPATGERVFGAIASRMEKWQYWRAGQARAIAVSGRVRQDLARWYGFRDAAVVHHGVDAATFSPANRVLWRDVVRAEIGVPAGERLFLFVGDLRKGAEAAIRALGRGWLLCVGGTPPEPYRALAVSMGCGGRVVFRGTTDRVERYYAAADVFLLPTPYDAFGMVVLEAMAAGLPVIVSCEAGAAEVIRHGENGLVLRDEAELGALMEMAAERPEMGSAARETALEHGWDRVARETMEVYEAARQAPRILAFATQGAGGNDEARLRALLGNFRCDFFSFDRAHKAAAFRGLVRAIARGRYDLAVMEGTGIAGGAALLVGRLMGQRYAVSSGDAVAPFIAAKQPALGWLFGLYERLLYRMAAGFIGWSPYLTGRALTFGVKRAATAAGWAENGAAVGVRPPGALVIGIVGSLDWNGRVGYCYGLELVRALSFVKRKDVSVLIVGGGSGLAELKRIAGERVVFAGAVPREEVPGYLAAMDIASLPQSCDGVGSFRYTTKLSEYIAAGLPIVTGQLPLAYDLDDGWMWRLPGDAPWDERYARALAALIDRMTPEELAAKRAAVPVGCAVFDRARQVARVTELIRDILEPV